MPNRISNKKTVFGHSEPIRSPSSGCFADAFSVYAPSSNTTAATEEDTKSSISWKAPFRAVRRKFGRSFLKKKICDQSKRITELEKQIAADTNKISGQSKRITELEKQIAGDTNKKLIETLEKAKIINDLELKVSEKEGAIRALQSTAQSTVGELKNNLIHSRDQCRDKDSQIEALNQKCDKLDKKLKETENADEMSSATINLLTVAKAELERKLKDTERELNRFIENESIVRVENALNEKRDAEDDAVQQVTESVHKENAHEESRLTHTLGQLADNDSVLWNELVLLNEAFETQTGELNQAKETTEFLKASLDNEKFQSERLTNSLDLVRQKLSTVQNQVNENLCHRADIVQGLMRWQYKNHETNEWIDFTSVVSQQLNELYEKHKNFYDTASSSSALPPLQLFDTIQISDHTFNLNFNEMTQTNVETQQCCEIRLHIHRPDHWQRVINAENRNCRALNTLMRLVTNDSAKAAIMAAIRKTHCNYHDGLCGSGPFGLGNNTIFL